MKHPLAIPAFGGLALALGLVVAGAAEPPASGVTPPPAQAWMHGSDHGGMHHGMRRGMHNRMMMMMMGPRGAAIRDMLALEHLYRAQGHVEAVVGLYRGVLARSQDPLLRNFAYSRLARAELAPRDAGAAIQTLRQALDENLKAVAALPAPRMPMRR
ncbi:MAG: hypothetical protein KGI40_06725 [Xanthomonadaceae bacterium]|nr:hypothetical protein [Xanthomonadaceae bacterium]